MFPTGLFVVLCGVSSVLSEKKLCNLDDNKCLTNAAIRTFKEFISGLPGVEPSDPLTLDLIEGNLPTLKYRLINGSLTGMLNCNVDLAQILVKESKYNYHILCPHLILESDYEVKGKLGPEFIEGNGTCKIDIYDYHILLSGDYEKFISINGKLHIQMKNHILEYEAKSKLNYDCKNLFNGDKEKSDILHKYANENWQTVHKLTRKPAMEAFMNKYVDNVNAYLKVKAIEDLFYSEQTDIKQTNL